MKWAEYTVYNTSLGTLLVLAIFNVVAADIKCSLQLYEPKSITIKEVTILMLVILSKIRGKVSLFSNTEDYRVVRCINLEQRDRLLVHTSDAAEQPSVI